MYKKVSLLSAFISVHKLDISCLSETYLNSETSSYDDNLEIPGYNIRLNVGKFAFIVKTNYPLD